MRVEFGVLGPVTAWDGAGNPVALRGPRHRAVLARLVVARGRVVPVGHLVDDLWPVDPPRGAVSAVRTFVAALRRALEPDRPPRAPARLLVTDGPGYALRAEADAVDAWRFERAVAGAAALPPGEAGRRLDGALGWWRGPAYADFAEEPWARAERARLGELRLHAVERAAAARLELGRAAEAVPELDAHVAGHPWREDAWRLLALALYRSGRQGDALAVLRRARTLLVEQLGVDPGPALRRLEADVLAQAPGLETGVAPARARGPGAGVPARGWESGDVSVPERERGAPASGRERGAPEDVPAPGRERDMSAPGRGRGAPEPGPGLEQGFGPGPGLEQGPGPRPRPGPEREPGRGPDADTPVRVPGLDADIPDPLPGLDADITDPSPGMAADTADRLPGFDGAPGRPVRTPPDDPAARVWAAAAADYDRTVASGARTRLESTVGLLRNLAVTGGGGLEAARRHRVAAAVAAEELGDPELTARVIGSYDVPAIWTRLDDPEQAARIVAAAGRTLAALPPGAHPAARARLLATIALESRGGTAPRVASPEGTAPAGPSQAGATPAGTAQSRTAPAGTARAHATQAGTTPGTPPTGTPPTGTPLAAAPSASAPVPDARAAAREAERIARGLDDPALLAFVLNAVWMQSFDRPGLAPRRDATGAEMVALSARNGLPTYEVLGHLIRLQARAALGDFSGADGHVTAAERLAERHELPLVGVFTRWYAALRLSVYGAPVPEAEAAYREAAARLDGAGMPALERGLLPLALLCLRLSRALPARTAPATPGAEADALAEAARAAETAVRDTGAARSGWGPYEPWVRPVLLLADGRREAAEAALHSVPDPPRDLLSEAMWCLTARVAIAVDDRRTMERARAELAPAAAELAGAGSGLLTLGPVGHHLDALAASLRRTEAPRS